MSKKGLRKIVSKICNNCLICKTEKIDNANYGIPKIFFKTLKVKEIIAVDLKGSILAKYYQNYSRMSEFYILVVVDLYSRYSEIEILKKIDSVTICSYLEKICFRRFSSLLRLLSDNGRQFISQNFKRLLEKYHISHVTSAPYNPTENNRRKN
ncbi:hypothetical protein DMUE_0374 [Dictyocoela muelleri]|nr:hypothetical protein DMUE_0374 [Dictyocoela muelleri]